MKKNNSTLIISVLVLIVLIFIINNTNVSKFGSSNTINITVASSDITNTTFVLQKYTKCYESGSSAGIVCDDNNPAYSVTSPQQSINPVPIEYQNNLSGYYEKYLSTNLFNNVSINVFHCNFKNTLNDYIGQIVKEDYITGLGSISCIDNYCLSKGYDECKNITIGVKQGSITQQSVTLNNGDFLIITQDRYINYGLYSKPTVYQYNDDGTSSSTCPSTPTTDTTACGTGNIINNTKCGGCNINLVVNSFIPDIELPLLRVYNGIVLSTVTDFIDNKGVNCYLIPKLFINNVTISITGGSIVQNMKYVDFANKMRPFIGKNSYITRMDTDPNSDGMILYVYYTILDQYNVYSSDSCICMDLFTSAFTPFSGFITDITKWIQTYTITNTATNTRFSDRHLMLQLNTDGLWPGMNAHVIIQGMGVNIDTEANDGIEYNYLRMMRYMRGIVISFWVEANANGMNSSHELTIPDISNYLLNSDLSLIWCSVSLKDSKYYLSGALQILCKFFSSVTNSGPIWSDKRCHYCP